MQLVERYEESMALVRGSAGWIGVSLLLAALVAAPWILGAYLVYIFNLIWIHVLVAVGLNLLVGYAGQISLGHVGFFAIGAYSAAHLVMRLPEDLAPLSWLGGPFVLSALAGGLVAAAFGYLVGLPALRLEGPYLAIVTLGFGLAVQQVLINWPAASGGRVGLFLPTPRFGPWALGDERGLYYLNGAFAVALILVAFNLTRSHIGRAFIALRDSDIAAQVTGVCLQTYKTLAFAVSAFYAGVGGALMGYNLGYLEPTMFDLRESIYYLAMVVVGGLGTIPGAILGAALLTLLQLGLTGAQEYVPVVFGAIVILIMTLEPLGLYGRWLKIKLWAKTWPL